MQQKSVEPASPGAPDPQLSEELVCGGVFDPVQEYPIEGATHVDAVVSSAQVPPPSAPVAVQQYNVELAFPGVPGPQLSSG